ncbi:MAG: lipid-A-disaccharide synthase [Phormidesmis sp.]
MKSAQIFIHTGEVSGDLQGSLLIEALHRQAQRREIALSIIGVGGHRMEAAGAKVLVNTLQLSAIGLLEALPYYIAGRNMQKQVNQYLQDHPPDLMVLLDYKGPNVAVGKFLRKWHPQVPMVYYIAPQEWVFPTPSTPDIVAISDKLLAIFPEEATYYQRAGANAHWVGHPLVDRLAEPMTKAEARATLEIVPEAKVVTLLPASRKQELKYVMPVMFAAAQRMQAQQPDIQFLVPMSLPNFAGEIKAAIAQYALQARAVDKADGQSAIAAADVVINKSGTVNLEVALMNVPQVVMYRLSNLTAFIAKYIVRFSGKYVSPVNLMENQPIVPEFLQWDANPQTISAAALELLNEESKRQTMLAGYAQMRQAMGKAGVCDRAANEILDTLSDNLEPQKS